MKAFFLAVTLLGLLFVGARDLRAQAYPYYDPYWDVQYQHPISHIKYTRLAVTGSAYPPDRSANGTHYIVDAGAASPSGAVVQSPDRLPGHRARSACQA